MANNVDEDDDDDEELDLHRDENQFEDFEFSDDTDEANNLLNGAMTMIKKGAKNLNPITGIGNLRNGIQDLGGKGLDGIMKIGTMFDKDTTKAKETKLETAQENK